MPIIGAIIAIVIYLICAGLINKYIKTKSRFNFYLAGPMRGYADFNKSTFIKVANLIRDQGHTVFNPAEVNDDNMDFEDCMIVDLDAVVNRCDKIVFLPGWRKSEGANAEALAAFVCGKPSYSVKMLNGGKELKLVFLNLTNYYLPYSRYGNKSKSLTPRTKRKASC